MFTIIYLERLIILLTFVCFLFAFPSGPGFNVLAGLAGDRVPLGLLLLPLDPERPLLCAFPSRQLPPHSPYNRLAPVLVLRILLDLVVELMLEGKLGGKAPYLQFILDARVVLGHEILVRLLEDFITLFFTFL